MTRRRERRPSAERADGQATGHPPSDLDGLVRTVVGIETRLALFGRRLDRFTVDAERASSSSGHGTAMTAPGTPARKRRPFARQNVFPASRTRKS